MSQQGAAGVQGLFPDPVSGTGGAARTPARHDNPALAELRRQLGDDRIVDLFVADFLAVVDERIGTVGSLLDEHRIEECVTALFTLETSGTMVGADDLARIAGRLRRALPREDHCATARLFVQLQAAGREAAGSLDHS